MTKLTAIHFAVSETIKLLIEVLTNVLTRPKSYENIIIYYRHTGAK
jgi:hypothetical protein